MRDTVGKARSTGRIDVRLPMRRSGRRRPLLSLFCHPSFHGFLVLRPHVLEQRLRELPGRNVEPAATVAALDPMLFRHRSFPSTAAILEVSQSGTGRFNAVYADARFWSTFNSSIRM
jgi:hypothetical protein